MDVARIFSNSFSSLLYPSRCCLCATLGDDAICAECLEEFQPVDLVRRTSDGGSLALTAAVYVYEGRTGQAVRRLKYARSTGLAAPMAQQMAEAVERMGLQHYDLVVPIPIHWSRRFMRGFNQAELLCEQLPNVASHVLRRVRRTRPQVGLSRERRVTNLVDAFRASPIVTGRSVLLVDDVLTSGQTARECAKALVQAGAREVAIIAFAGEHWRQAPIPG